MDKNFDVNEMIKEKPKFKHLCEECEIKFKDRDIIYLCNNCDKWICFDCLSNYHENHEYTEYEIIRGICGELNPQPYAARVCMNEVTKEKEPKVLEPTATATAAVARASMNEADKPDEDDLKLSYTKEMSKGMILLKGDIKAFLENMKGDLGPLPNKVDLRKYCSQVCYQGELNSSAAIAATGLIEYLENIFYEKYIKSSSLFLYKVARNFSHLTGNVNVLPRTIIGALVLFGIPPEEYWPYTDKLGAEPDGFDREPTAFCYAFAQNYKATVYLRLDQAITTNEELLEKIKTGIAHEMPSIIGFDLYESIWQDVNSGKIPFPQKTEELKSPNHSVLLVGYNDSIKIKNKNNNKKTKGAFLVKNSWGIKWGDKGYGWLPYEYVLKGKARDCWIIIQNNWVDLDEFQH